MLNKYDCVILGAGPAGLAALTYLSRFHRQAVALGSKGRHSRMQLIDRTYNLPGYPRGISGGDLLDNLREQAEAVGGTISGAMACGVEGTDGNFTVHLDEGESISASKIILAMGVRDKEPDIPGITSHVGDFVRYCPVCDGYEHTNKKLGILGSGKSVVRHALFLRTFSDQISVFLHGETQDSMGAEAAKLNDCGITILQPRIQEVVTHCHEASQDHRGNGVLLSDGKCYSLDVLYSALGCEVNLAVVSRLGLDLDDEGYVITDIEQRTNIPGIFAVGDLVSQYNQISIAFGQATVAAITIHNSLGH